MRLHCRPYLPREHQLWHLPPRGSDVWGDEGNNVAENTELMCASPRAQAESKRRIPCLEWSQHPEWDSGACPPFSPSPALGALCPLKAPPRPSSSHSPPLPLFCSFPKCLSLQTF